MFANPAPPLIFLPGFSDHSLLCFILNIPTSQTHSAVAHNVVTVRPTYDNTAYNKILDIAMRRPVAVTFRVLWKLPTTVLSCHIITYNNLIWVSKPGNQ